MNTNVNSSEVSISYEKIKANFKKHWKICLTTVGIAILISIMLTINAFLQSSSNSKKNYYQATASVYVDWDENVRDVFTNLEPNATTNESWKAYAESYGNLASVYIEQWQKVRVNAILSDCNSFLGSNLVYNRINEELLNNGYEERNGTDAIVMTMTGTSHLFTLSVTGYQDEDRVQFLAQKVVEILLEEGTDKLGLENSYIIDEPSTYQVYKKTSSTGTTTYVRKMEYPDKSSKNKESSNSTFDIIFSSTNILLVAVGFIIGIAIIVIYILKDQTVRTINELDESLKLKLLGEISSQDKKSLAIIGTTIAKSLNNNHINNILLTTSVKTHCVSQLSTLGKYISNEGLSVVVEDNLSGNINAIKKASEVKEIILFIAAGNEDMSNIKQAVNRIEVLGGKLVGYIFYK